MHPKSCLQRVDWTSPPSFRWRGCCQRSQNRWSPSCQAILANGHHGGVLMTPPQKWVPEDDSFRFKFGWFSGSMLSFRGSIPTSTSTYIYCPTCTTPVAKGGPCWSRGYLKTRVYDGDFPNKEWGWPFKYRPGKNSSDCLDMFRCWVKESNEAMSDLKLLWVWCKLASEYLSHTRVQQPPLQTGILLPRILMA